MNPRIHQYFLYGFILCILMVSIPWLYVTLNQDIVWFRKGEKSFFAGEYEKAAGFFIRSVQVGQPAPKTLNLLGDSYLAMDKFPEALDAFSKLRSMVPGDLNAMVKLAQVLALNREPQKALLLLEEVLEKKPDHKIAMLWLARILTGKGDFDRAIDIYYQLLGEES